MNAFLELTKTLESIYEFREAENIADWVIEKISGKQKWQRRISNGTLNEDQKKQLSIFTKELLTSPKFVISTIFFPIKKCVKKESSMK